MSIFRIATCNTANFNYRGVRFARRSGAEGDPIADPIYARKVAWLSGLLDAARPDLIGFQELFHKDAIAEVVRATHHLEGATIYAPDLDDNVKNGEAGGPFCGLVSRFPVCAPSSILAFPDDVVGRLRVRRSDAASDAVGVPIERFRRPVLRAEVQLRDDTTATVFVAHLKSKRRQLFEGEDEDDPVVQALGDARSLIMRAAEAVALRSLIVAAGASSRNPIIVMGDLNDDLASVTTQTIGGDDPFFGTPQRKPAGFDRLLYNVHVLQERLGHRHVSYSHIHNGRYELLDHIFVSQELVAEHPNHIARVQSTRIYNDHVIDSHTSSEPDDFASVTSDHGIPVTEIAWRSERGAS